MVLGSWSLLLGLPLLGTAERVPIVFKSVGENAPEASLFGLFRERPSARKAAGTSYTERYAPYGLVTASQSVEKVVNMQDIFEIHIPWHEETELVRWLRPTGPGEVTFEVLADGRVRLGGHGVAEGDDLGPVADQSEAAKDFYAVRPINVTFRTEAPGSQPWEGGKVEGHLYTLAEGSNDRLRTININPGESFQLEGRVGDRVELALRKYGSTGAAHRAPYGKGRIFRIWQDGVATIRDVGSVVGTPVTNFPAVLKGPHWDEVVAAERASCEEALIASAEDQAYFCGSRFDYRVLNRAKFLYPPDFAQRAIRSTTRAAQKLAEQQQQQWKKLSQNGFETLDIPQPLFEKLAQFHREQRRTAVPEELPWNEQPLTGRDTDAWLLELPEALRQECVEAVGEAVAAWSGIAVDKLEATSVYGARLYHRGAKVGRHVDPQDAHVLSAVLEVGRAGDWDTAQWPFQIEDHVGEEHAVPSRVGQMILYESATCPHGRAEPFSGGEYANVFVHFAPKDWGAKYQLDSPTTAKPNTDL